ncbi:MAG: cupin domain-containing protein [Nitrososphaerota archaeon]|nr:cupin domain-containing protein [Candidatus Calditenuaceae archaeon]MDW8073230.1 cupin domain-containing protein [Nitrososphaerota archaeon]
MDVWFKGVWDELFPGVYRRILAHDSNLMLMLVRIAPGAVVPQHSHFHLQAGVVLRGSLLFRTERGEVTLREGDSYLIHPWEPHEVLNMGEEAIALDVFTPARDDYAKAAKRPDMSV